MTESADNSTTPDPKPSPIEAMCFPRFANAAAHACVFELQARLLADKDDALQANAFKDLSVVIKEIVGRFDGASSPSDLEFLVRCAGIRNKLLHLELSRATGRLVELGEQLRDAGVIQVDLESGAATVVATTSTRDGRVVGWLLESTGSGAFDAATNVFSRGISILRRLMDVVDKRAMSTTSKHT